MVAKIKFRNQNCESADWDLRERETYTSSPQASAVVIDCASAICAGAAMQPAGRQALDAETRWRPLELRQRV